MTEALFPAVSRGIVWWLNTGHGRTVCAAGFEQTVEALVPNRQILPRMVLVSDLALPSCWGRTPFSLPGGKASFLPISFKAGIS